MIDWIWVSCMGCSFCLKSAYDSNHVFILGTPLYQPLFIPILFTFCIAIGGKMFVVNRRIDKYLILIAAMLNIDAVAQIIGYPITSP
jgi:hypothetical protein